MPHNEARPWPWRKLDDVPRFTKADLAEATDSQLRDLRIAWEAIQNDRGCFTPAEAFLNQLLLAYSFGGLEPEWVEGALKEFEDDYWDMRRTALRFNRHTRVIEELDERRAAAEKEQAPRGATREALKHTLGRVDGLQSEGYHNGTAPEVRG